MPPKRKIKSKKAKRTSTQKVKRSKKSKSNKTKRKSTFRNKKLKKSLPKIPRLTPQERAQGLSRIQKGEYQEGIHQPYIRSGKDVVVNPAYLNSAAYLSGGVPINAEVDIDYMMDTTGDYRPGYEPEPDAKRQTAESAARFNQMLDEKEQKRVAKELKSQEDARLAERERRRQRMSTLDQQLTDELHQLRDQSIQRREAFAELENPTEAQLRAAEAAHETGQEALRRISEIANDLRELTGATWRGAHMELSQTLLAEIMAIQQAISSSGIDLDPVDEDVDPGIDDED